MNLILLQSKPRKMHLKFVHHLIRKNQKIAFAHGTKRVNQLFKIFFRLVYCNGTLLSELCHLAVTKRKTISDNAVRSNRPFRRRRQKRRWSSFSLENPIQIVLKSDKLALQLFWKTCNQNFWFFLSSLAKYWKIIQGPKNIHQGNFSQNSIMLVFQSKSRPHEFWRT